MHCFHCIYRITSSVFIRLYKNRFGDFFFFVFSCIYVLLDKMFTLEGSIFQPSAGSPSAPRHARQPSTHVLERCVLGAATATQCGRCYVPGLGGTSMGTHWRGGIGRERDRRGAKEGKGGMRGGKGDEKVGKGDGRSSKA